MGVIDGDLFRRPLRQRIAGKLGPLRKGVGHGGQLCGRLDAQRAGCRSAASPAATDQTDPQPIAAGGVDAAGDRQAGGHRNGSQDSGLCQKFAARGRRRGRLRLDV
jgi:hypothetical protein